MRLHVRTGTLAPWINERGPATWKPRFGLPESTVARTRATITIFNMENREMSFADWIENMRELGADPAEIDAAIGAEQRLKAAAIIAREIFTNPSERAVLEVFADVCANATLGVTVHPRQRPTLH